MDDTLYSEIDYLKSAYGEIVNFAYSKTKVSPPPTSKEVWSEMVAVYLRGENAFTWLNDTLNIQIPISTYLDINESGSFICSLNHGDDSIISYNS